MKTISPNKLPGVFLVGFKYLRPSKVWVPPSLNSFMAQSGSRQLLIAVRDKNYSNLGGRIHPDVL